MSTFLKYALLALFAVNSATMASGATFFNGSFELPDAAGTTYLDAGNASFVTGWVHAGGTAISEFYTGAGAWPDIDAHEGEHWVGFGASGGNGGSLSQTFDTIVGVEYFVSYFLATQEFVGTPPSQTAQVDIFDAINGGPAIATVSNTFATEAGAWFAGQGLSFVALSASTTLTFTDMTAAGPDNDVNWTLDSVSVATPEPASWMLLGLGAGLLGVFRKAR